MITPANPPAEQPSSVPISLGFEPDGRMTVITPDGVSISEPPPPIPQDALDRIAELPDATIKAEGYWE